MKNGRCDECGAAWIGSRYQHDGIGLRHQDSHFEGDRFSRFGGCCGRIKGWVSYGVQFDNGAYAAISSEYINNLSRNERDNKYRTKNWPYYQPGDGETTADSRTPTSKLTPVISNADPETHSGPGKDVPHTQEDEKEAEPPAETAAERRTARLASKETAANDNSSQQSH